MEKPFAAYSGNEPYIFVSYSRKDSSSVYPELKWLNEVGFNIWYDDGIEAGAEWTEALASAIRQARVFLFFVTPNSVASQNCRNEVHAAVQHELPLIAVHLQETRLPDGLALTLSPKQAIQKYEIAVDDYADRLLSRLSHLLDKETSEIPEVKRFAKLPLTGVGISLVLVSVLMASIWFLPGDKKQNSLMSFVYNEEPVRDLIGEIADVSQLNLIASDEIAGSITIAMKNVTWREALDAVAVSRGYHVKITENAIYISPRPEDFDVLIPN